MTVTPVGMRCPECARERTKVRQPTGAATRSDAPATYALIALCVLAYLGELFGGGGTSTFDGGGRVIREGGLFGPSVDNGEWYRLITSGFLHAGILHLGLNMFALYILGTILEPGIGSVRFVAIYFVSLLGGSFGALLLDPREITVGASGAIFGLMAATFIVARGRGMDELASQVGIFVVINLVFTISIPGISIGGHLGGLVAGGVAALLITAVERRRTQSTAAIETVGLAALAVASVAGALIAAGQTGTGLV